MNPRRWTLLVVLGVLVSSCALMVRFSWREIARQERVGEACAAANAGRWTEAIALTEDLVGPDAEGRLAAECRCWGLVATMRTGECGELVAELFGEDPGAGWVPPPPLAVLAINDRLARGEGKQAHVFARRASAAYPEDMTLLQLALPLRVAEEGLEPVAKEVEAGLAEGRLSPRARAVLADIYHENNDYEREIRLLGREFVPPESPLFESWFHRLAKTEAALGNLEAVQKMYERWRQLAGPLPEIEAHYALRLSVSSLMDPEHSHIELLEKALAQEEAIDNPELTGWVYKRLLSHLMVAGEFERALQVFERSVGKVEIQEITRPQIERALRMQDLSSDRPGELAFHVLETEPGDELWVSDNAGAEPDAEYERFPISVQGGGTLRVERLPRPVPERWVLKDREGRARASGTTWPEPGGEASVAVRRGEPAGLPPYEKVNRAPGDGRRRVFTVVLDCADWRLVQYLRARDELPFLEFMLRAGSRAVLTVDPPMTAVAMEKLVWPSRGGSLSFVSLVHRFGIEIGGLESVGKNPFGFLEAFLPEGRDLFEELGAGNRVVANMLFSHGAIDAGHHAQVTGPHGKRRVLESIQASRPLRAEELRQMPRLSRRDERARAEAVAAEFDVARKLVDDRDIDMLLLRIEPLDLLTHTLFAELLESGQDDGSPALLEAYRYIDTRLVELYEALDEDDVLIVMSDHGIRTAMVHERDAIFVALGLGIPAGGRAEGTPDLAGIPFVLAGLLGAETGWANTGAASWMGGSSERLAGSASGETSGAVAETAGAISKTAGAISKRGAADVLGDVVSGTPNGI